MPYLFDSSLPTGSMDPAGPYTEAKIVTFKHDGNKKVISGTIEYGNTVSGVWKRGLNPVGLSTNFRITGADYDAAVANTVALATRTDPSDPVTYMEVDDSGVTLYVERGYITIKRAAYLWCAANTDPETGNPFLAAGTVV